MSEVGNNHRYGTWKGLPEAASQPIIRPTQMIAHSIVGSARSAYNYFRDGTSLESHWIFPYDGAAWQLMESNRRADANYLANRWPNGTGALSAETEDNRDPDNDPWTDPQVDRLIDWFRWGNAMFAIPLVLPENPADPGIGYHTLWPNHWSKYAGKTPLALDTVVPTADGPKALRDVVVGDRVFAEDGSLCNVLDTIDVTPERAYRITFDDGAEVVASDSHLWSTLSMGALRQRLRERKMVDGVRGATVNRKTVDGGWPEWCDLVDTAFLSGKGSRAWGIPVAGSCDGDDRDLPVDPYLLGLWLGDGGARDGVMHAGLVDADEIHAHFTAAGYETGAVRECNGLRTWRPLGMERELRLLGILGNKHIPTPYLAGSENQRLALLAGLLDSDGYISSSGNSVEFTNTNESLARGALLLASSLGQRPRIVKRSAVLNGVDHGPAYRVTWRATRQLFRLERKAARYEAGKTTLRSQVRTIDSVVEVPIVPMRCLRVDSPHSLFCVTEHFIPTHNCPGKVRIEQFHDLILPALTQPKENDMEPRAFVKAGFLAALDRYPRDETEMANHLAYLAFHGQEAFLDNLETSAEAKALPGR